ncbi:MAG: hypothetical protein ACFUZC_15570 [Chthoniobacteraceae bacterium]
MKRPASPIKSALEEVDALRRLFKTTLDRYAAAVETDLEQLEARIGASGEDQTRDLRDITGLLRMLDVTPQKGRRRDLKKIEKTLEDALDIAQRWENHP